LWLQPWCTFQNAVLLLYIACCKLLFCEWMIHAAQRSHEMAAHHHPVFPRSLLVGVPAFKSYQPRNAKTFRQLLIGSSMIKLANNAADFIAILCDPNLQRMHACAAAWQFQQSNQETREGNKRRPS
jgi:hypothetical protein